MEVKTTPEREERPGFLLRNAMLGLEQLRQRMVREIRRTPNGERAFFDTAEFSWIPRVEAATDSMCRELATVMSEEEIPAFQDVQVEQRVLTQDNRWKIFDFMAYGAVNERNCRRCPESWRALQDIPKLRTALFSILAPRKRLPPHEGPYSGVLRYHLGLMIPREREKCGIRVKDEVRHWERGKSLVFDDGFMHEAWNETDEVRVVLFVDFERALPARLAVLNKLVLYGIKFSPFIQNALERIEKFERRTAVRFKIAPEPAALTIAEGTRVSECQVVDGSILGMKIQSPSSAEVLALKPGMPLVVHLAGERMEAKLVRSTEERGGHTLTLQLVSPGPKWVTRFPPVNGP